ncbi:hypothetical protein HDV05_006959 [Chytridiales sp. JEL 0842]|nr:hypothetical protein HDV05_006959 [Chytridiales sp. JEL 0842]
MLSTNPLNYPIEYALPYELWNRVFSFLDAPSARCLSMTSHFFRRLSEDPHSRALWLMEMYGRSLTLLYGVKSHRGVFTPEVARLSIAYGCTLPRFVIQLVDKEYHKSDRVRRPVSTSLFYFFVTAGFKLYGENADFKEDDVTRFERILYAAGNTQRETLEALTTLIETFKFVPIRGMGSPLEETVYLVSKVSLPLIRSLISNGLDLLPLNDPIMERVLWRADISDSLLKSYLSVGFQLSPGSIKRGLQMARPSTLDVLRNRVPPRELQKLAEEAVFDMMGPTIRGWNFTPESLDYLLSNFEVNEDVMEIALFRIPGAPTDSPDSFPATRCYMKANPCPVWKWVLRTYGPDHRFTMACFDDALSRAAAERELHALHDHYLEAGVQFRPRHVKILACRVLHRDMTSNALHLLRVLKTQVLTSAREYAKELSNQNTLFPAPLPSYYTSTTSSTSTLTDVPPTSNASIQAFRSTFKDTWLKALREEITENAEWDHRMRTTQLEGGPRGGAYRISRPPEDALKFLEVGRELVGELLGIEKELVKERNNSVHVGGGGVLGFFGGGGVGGSSPSMGRRLSVTAKGRASNNINNNNRRRPTTGRRNSTASSSSVTPDNASARTIAPSSYSTGLSAGGHTHAPAPEDAAEDDDADEENFDAAPAAAPAADADDEEEVEDEDEATVSGHWGHHQHEGFSRRSSRSRRGGFSRRVAAWWSSLSERLSWDHRHQRERSTSGSSRASSF